MGVPPVDWEAESYPAYSDFAAIPLFAVFLFAVRYLLDRFVFEVVMVFTVLFPHHAHFRIVTGVATHAGRIKIRKFKESAWKCIYFLSAELLALSVTYKESWFTSTKNFWVGPGDQVWPDQRIKFKLKLVYMYAAGFYTYSIFALQFWEIKRSDFGISMVHHVVSVILIALSYIFSRFARVGSIVLAIHDASDVFLELGKISKYSGYQLLADVSFLIFVCSWAVLRLIYYPFWILWSTSFSYEVVPMLDKKKHKFDGPLHYYVFNCLLFSLLVLNIYWWVLMYRMLVEQILSKGHVGDDVRSGRFSPPFIPP
nr:putative alternaria stem canker resistance protein [Oryza sativa Japonica Group]BAD16340.1 putative alternaria stem canker resistance protein [Oryza sativa Japonica Group]